jgi:hypothetical protein
MYLVVKALVVALMSLPLVACSSAYRVVKIPERAADMYPLSQTKDGVTIAIDEMRGAARAHRYFGADLIGSGILPVVVVVSNFSPQTIAVKPADVLLQRGRDIVDPLPLESVVAVATSTRWIRQKTREQVEGFFSSAAFKETVLLPNETYQGVMFFANVKPRKRDQGSFSVMSLFDEGGPRIRVAVTDFERPNRVHFGPFSLSSQEVEFGRARLDMMDRF